MTALSVAVAGLIAMSAVAGGQTADAAPSTPNAPRSAAASVSPPPSTPPVPPTIDVRDSDSSVTKASGYAAPGADLRILDPAHPASSLCTPTAAASDGAWSCWVTVASGAAQRLTIRDLTDSSLPDVTSDAFSVLAAPVITTRAGVSPGAQVAGTGFPRSTVSVMLRSGGSVAGRATVNGSGSWSLTLPATAAPSGTYSVSATQASTAVPAVPVSSASAPVSIVVDRDAPAAPVVLHPVAASTVTTQPFVFDGRGEPGASVTTYIDSNPVCTATVSSSGSWNCSTRGLLIPAGSRVVQAAQHDAAGNYGPPSAAVKVVFAAKTSSPTSTPTTAPSQSAPTHSSTPHASGEPTAPATSSAPTSGASGSGGSTPGSGGGAGGGSGGSQSSGGGGGGSGDLSGANAGALGSSTSWTGSTGFGRNLPTLSQSVGGWSWPFALILGATFMLLVIAPLRLAASAMGGRLAVRARQLTGRNRSRAERDLTPLFSPVSAAAAAIVIGALLVALAAGVDDQVRYVRLVIAIVIGIVVINGLGLVLPTLVTGRRLGLRLHVALSPRLFAAAAVACLLTRLLDIDPPMVLGVLLAVGLVDDRGRTFDETGEVRRGGILATVQLGSLTLVSFVAWVLHGLVPINDSSFVVEITRETLATVCLAGLGSVIVLLIPLGRLPGRALYSWSREVLAGFVVVGVAAATVVVAGNPDEAFPIMPFVVGAVVFAVLALSAWVWVRFVEPALDDRT